MRDMHMDDAWLPIRAAGRIRLRHGLCSASDLLRLSHSSSKTNTASTNHAPTPVMDPPSAQLHQEVRDAVTRQLEHRRPLLHHLNADSSWLLQIPRPVAATKKGGRAYYNILIDPWLAGGQSDVARWFSQQWHRFESACRSIAEVEELAREVEILASSGLRLGKGRQPNGDDTDMQQTFIDAVAISHEFTDHCHRDTLEQIDRYVPVFASEVRPHAFSLLP